MNSSLQAFRRDPWPSFPSASTPPYPIILLAPSSAQPIKWSGWCPR